MGNKREDAPKIVNIGVWTAAVAGAFVFALTVGISLYNTMNTPISADTAAPTKSCKSGEALLAFNNYPTKYFSTAGNVHTGFESAMGGTWRCSAYCVPVPADANTATNDQKTQDALTKYLTGATTNGKPVIVAKTETEFTSMLQSNPTNLENTVILTSTKTACQGYYNGVGSEGASTDYKSLVLKIDNKPVEVAPVVANNTVQEQETKTAAQKQSETTQAQEAAPKTATELQKQTEAGATEGGKPRVTTKPSGSGSGDGPLAKTHFPKPSGSGSGDGPLAKTHFPKPSGSGNGDGPLAKTHFPKP